MQIRGQEIPIATTMVGGYPRPHWLQGRVFGTGEAPLYTSMAQKVAFEDAVALCIRDQEQAGLDLLADGVQYEDLEADGNKQDVLFHHATQLLRGFTSYGRPISYEPWSAYYQSEVVGKIEWYRTIYGGVADAARRATDRPVKLTFLTPLLLSLVVTDKYYNDHKALAMDFAAAINEDLKYCREVYGLESIQLVEVSQHLIPKEPWHVECLNKVVEGLEDLLTMMHVCYGRTEGQVVRFGNKVPETIALFKDLNIKVLQQELAGRHYEELSSIKGFPEDRVFCAGVINDHELQVETVDEIAAGVRKCLDYVPADRLMLSTDCGLRWLPRNVAKMKLESMVKAAQLVRSEL